MLDHHLTKKELDFILSKKTNVKKHTPLLNNWRDDGPHQDGIGMAILPLANKHSSWEIKKWVDVSHEELYERVKEVEKETNKITILHLRNRCHLKSKCKGSNAEKSLENTHPFYYKNIIFTHNGTIYHFKKYKKYLETFIATDLLKEIKGETDSEFLFYMFLTRYLTSKNQSMKYFHKLLEEIIIDLQMFCPEFTMNIIFSTPEFSVITRYIYSKQLYTIKQHPPSLYYDTLKGFTVTSEPLSNKYKLVPENTVIYVDHTTKESYLQSILS
jgi:predicted glutamine amidotransferase